MMPELLMRQTAGLDWNIRHRGLAGFRAASEGYSRQRLEQGGEYRASDVQTLDTPVGVVGVAEEILANGAIVGQGKRAVHVKSDDGYDAIVYLEPRTVPLMPAGLPAVGERYTFVGRVQRPAALRGHADHLFLLSWERM